MDLNQIRVRGGVGLEFRATRQGTVAARVAESDGYRVRFPQAPDGVEAVLLNTGGGIAGGDDVHFTVDMGASTRACVSTVAAERIYRSNNAPANLRIVLKLDQHSTLAWLPQETLFFDGAHCTRTIDVNMAASADLTLVDMLVFGRRGSGERMTNGAIADCWRIRRDGHLLHMEALRLNGAIDVTLQSNAVSGGDHVTGTLLHVSRRAEDLLEAVRGNLPSDDTVRVAASAWDGKLIVRSIGGRVDRVRASLAAAVQIVSNRLLPRVWAT